MASIDCCCAGAACPPQCAELPARFSANLRTRVRALEVGEATLELREHDGALIDRISVAVRRPSRVALRFTPGKGSKRTRTFERSDGELVELKVGEEMSLEPMVFDRFDQRLQATEGLELQFDETSTVIGFDWSNSGRSRLIAKSPGLAVVRVAAGALFADVLIDVD